MDVSRWQGDPSEIDRLRLLSEDGHTVVVLSPEDREIARVPSPLRLLPQQAVLRGHTGDVNSATLSADARHVVTAGDDGTVRVWDALTLQSLAVIHAHFGRAIACTTIAAGSPAEGDGSCMPLIISAGHDSAIRVWQCVDRCPTDDARDSPHWACVGAFYSFDRLSCLAVHNSGLMVAGDLAGEMLPCGKS